MKNILLTFTGFHDPYSPGLVEGSKQPGPIISLLGTRNFDKVYLFTTPNTVEISAKTVQAVKENIPSTNAVVLDINLPEPTDYKGIIQGLRKHIPAIVNMHGGDHVFVAVASGTPQMHACWLMLVSAGEIPAKILHIRPPKFVTPDRPLVSEIDLSGKEFPTVRYYSTEDVEGVTDHDIVSLKQKAGIIGDNEALVAVLQQAMALAVSGAPILIFGETGTGKELLARFIHLASGRSQNSMVPINCGALPENLIESALFGHVKGAFTGAHADHRGIFSEADGGTLFMDEIGDLPNAVQVKLLRVLEDGLVEPLGTSQSHRVNVRILGATNKDLQRLVKKGQFRKDLYYRLAMGELTLPPLKDRRSDIAKIALSILDRLNRNSGFSKNLTVNALNRLTQHNWPGNVRDLAYCLERSFLLISKHTIDADDLLITQPVVYDDPLQAIPDPYDGFELEGFLSSARKQIILRALELAKGNKSMAARLVGISPQAVSQYLRKQKKDS